MNYERALMLAVIIGCFPPVSMKKECSNGHTYYSAIIKDCVACPSQSIGCTAMLNNETLDNCLDSCIPSFPPKVKTTANPTKTNHHGHRAQSVGMKNPVLISITATVVFVLFVVSVVIGRKFYKRRRHIDMVGNVDDVENRHICEENGLRDVNGEKDHAEEIQEKKTQNYSDGGKPVMSDSLIPSN